MKRYLLALSTCLAVSFSFAQSNIDVAMDPLEKRFMDSRKGYDLSVQQTLRQSEFWQSFLLQHGTWYVHFNEKNGMPHRAFGKPIPMVTGSPEEMALDFAQQHLGSLDLPLENLVYSGFDIKGKYTWANFSQEYEGLRVLGSRYSVKIHNNKVILFACDVFKDIIVSTVPALDATAAGTIAASAMTEQVNQIIVEPQNVILPVPGEYSNTYHLVYEAMIKTISSTGIPAHYYTLVDANTGEILYRQNKVAHHDHSKCHHHTIDPSKKPLALPPVVIASISGTVHPHSPYEPTQTMALPNVYVTVSGTDYTCDENGEATLPVSPGSNAQVRMMGPWCRVYTNGSTPSFTTVVNDGSNDLSFNLNSNIKERCAYKGTNDIHNHMKSWMPTFTGMDFQLPANVDVAGDCNAFYDGSTINFYAAGNGCNATALIADVIYHEYGHGINDNYYQSIGGDFINGAMGEGYADFWAISLTDNPVLGSGFYDTNEDGIRRYDSTPKVYPDDLVAEVHADGEIIMGAWYDTHLLLGANWDNTIPLFLEAYAGLQAETFNGNEGEAYTDVLIDVLQADDDDGDISNGTPNGNAIAEGFDIHGITLISNATIQHDNLEFADANAPVTFDSELEIEFPFVPYLQGVQCFYRINDGAWQSAQMTDEGSNEFTLDIDPQPAGTVIAYYMAATDLNMNTAGALPIAADKPVFPNLPFFTLVGVQAIKTHDCDDNNEFGSWQTGLNTDNATTGEWEQNFPIGSYTTDALPGTMVAVDHQHTEGGEECFVTENASGDESPIGENDVDGGRTTLQSPIINMTSYSNPIISYWRYYTNNPPGGANPGEDYWQVRITNNNGNSWTYIENTRTPDMSWRRNAFRVADYLEPTAQMRMQFIASDSTFIGQNLDGGSLIEAAMDDFVLYDSFEVGVEENTTEASISVYPTPAKDHVTVQYPVETVPETISITNAAGQVVWSVAKGKIVSTGNSTKIDISPLASGLYTISVITGNAVMTETFVRE